MKWRSAKEKVVIQKVELLAHGIEILNDKVHFCGVFGYEKCELKEVIKPPVDLMLHGE